MPHKPRKPKPGEISLYYGLDPEDKTDTSIQMIAAWGCGQTKPGAMYLMSALQRNLHNYLPGQKPDQSILKELEERGYDLSTLRITIKKKAPSCPPSKK